MGLEKIKLISIADILTISNGICGVLAVICFIYFYPNITIGTGLIFLGLVFDGMDGAAARKFGTKHDFGKHLDSISDALTFCTAPSVLVFVTFYRPIENLPIINSYAIAIPNNLIVLIVSILTLGLGLKRLIDFTVNEYKLKSFHGLATPAMAFLIIVIAHILDPHRPENDSMAIIYFSLIVITMGSFLMVSNIRYPKVRGKLGAVLAVAIILSLLSIEVQKWFHIGSTESIFFYYRIISFFGLSLIIAYVFISPIILALFLTNNDS
jgi:CDP-diacylglycerol--serine O-phosphatidyltransferase